MKKSLIALAVAGLVSAPAFAATSNVDVYGVMNIAIQDTDVSGTDLDVVDNVSRIGFKGSEDLGGGLKAVWQIEQGINATAGDTVSRNASVFTAHSDTTVTGTVADNHGAFGGAGLRNTFIGLAGSFGTALIGRHDTPYKIATGKYDIFGDTIGDYNTGRTGLSVIENNHDARTSNTIAYISPSFSGLTMAAAVVTSMDHLDSGDTSDAVSLAAMYANGPLTVDLAYQDVDAVDNSAWKVGVGYNFGDAKVGFVYENTDGDTGSAVRDGDSWMINGVYTMGPIALKAMYGNVDTDKIEGDMWVLGADYALSKRTSAYVVFSTADNDTKNTDMKGWNIGMKHSF